MKFRLTFLCLVLCAAAGCRDITSVQLGYIADRDKCRARSEENMAVYAQPTTYPMSEKEKNNTLLVLFCECMKEHDWKVAGCPKPKEVPKPGSTQPNNAPTVVIVQAPPAATAPPAPPEQPISCPLPLHYVPGTKKHKGTCSATPSSPVNTAPAPAMPPASQTPAPNDSDATLKKILNKE